MESYTSNDSIGALVLKFAKGKISYIKQLIISITSTGCSERFFSSTSKFCNLSLASNASGYAENVQPKGLTVY